MERQPMERRTMLAGTGLALTSAVAGCLSQLTGDGSNSQSEGKQYEIESTGDVEGSPLEHGVRLVQPRIDSSEQPLTLEVTVTNTSTETVKYGERRSALGLYERTDAFALYPPGEGAEFDEEAGLWVVPEPVAITMDFQVGQLGPGEGETQRLELIYAGEEQNYSGEGLAGRAPESFSFDLPYGVGDDEAIPDEGDSFEWQFTLGRVE